MPTIFKYPIILQDEFELDLPAGAEFLHLDVQFGEPHLWFRVEPSAPVVRQKFAVIGTGNPVYPGYDTAPHLGSFQLQGGRLVFHVFAGGAA